MKTLALLLVTITVSYGQQIRLSQVDQVQINLGVSNSVHRIGRERTVINTRPDLLFWYIEGQPYRIELSSIVYTNWYSIGSPVKETQNVNGFAQAIEIQKYLGFAYTNYILVTKEGSLTVAKTSTEMPTSIKYETNLVSGLMYWSPQYFTNYRSYIKSWDH